MKNNSIYVCPRTRSRLSDRGVSLYCDICDHHYRLMEGIPVFLAGKPVEDHETHKQLSELNEIAKKKNWKDALRDVYGAESNIFKYVTNHERLIFLDLLELNKDSVVLEIGSGLGQFTSFIADYAKQVYGLEVVAGQAQFASERCRQLGKDNVKFACGGDDCRLPYPDQSMDIVIMNLVFEWCSTRNPDESSAEGQKRMLAEVFRVLNPGGSVFLSTKNRFALGYILGRRDEHSYGMPFGNALPRWMHNLLLRLKGHKRPQGLLHSHDSLQSILCNAGFDRLQSYWANPEMRFPKHYIPTDRASIRSARESKNFSYGNMRSRRLLMPLIPDRMIKHLMPGLTFIGYKPWITGPGAKVL